MGRILTACALLFALSSARAQNQERNLIDRLLRPDMSLQNAAQNKKFVAVNRVPVAKHAAARALDEQKKSNWNLKSFWGGRRDFSTWQFNARSFHGSDKPANFSSPRQITNSKRSSSTQTAHNLRTAYETGRTVDSHGFADNRQFLGQGKSQKSLNRRNAPLTIEQVRELLNKNK
jgi:hypothetical protein